MTEISFYHLLHQPLSVALPKLLEKVSAANLKAVIKAGSESRVEELDKILWSYKPDSFLAHDTSKCKYPDQQPIYLTTGDENPAGATILILVDSMNSAHIGEYDRCLEMFDGLDMAAVSAARNRWKAYKDADHALTYWQQTEAGGWEKKA